MRATLALLILLSALTVGGCSTCSTDPSKVGLGCAIANHEGGVNKRVDQQIERDIAANDNRRRDLELRAQQQRIEASELRGEERRLRLKLASLNDDTAKANRKLSELRQTQRVTTAQILEVRKREQALSEKILQLNSKDNATAREIAALNEEARQLNADIDRLRSLQ